MIKRFGLSIMKNWIVLNKVFKVMMNYFGKPFGIIMICLWIVICLLGNILYVFLLYRNLHVFEIMVIFLSSVISCVLLFGIWKMKRWGWWLFVISTFLGWIVLVVYLSLNYIQTTGFVISLFGLVLTLMFSFLFKKETLRNFFVDEGYRAVGNLMLSIISSISLFYLGVEIVGVFYSLFISLVIFFTVLSFSGKTN